MNWNNPFVYKRNSVSAISPNLNDEYASMYSRQNSSARPKNYSNYYPQNTPEVANYGAVNWPNDSSYYLSTLPLYCCGWSHSLLANADCIALSSYKEGFHNNLQLVHGRSFSNKNSFDVKNVNEEAAYEGINVEDTSPSNYAIEGFDFEKSAEITVDYPITNLQWDPAMGSNIIHERFATSSDILRIYQVEKGIDDTYKLVKTHALANNALNSSSALNNSSPKAGSLRLEVTTSPPLTSCDWNKVNSNLIITSSVDTTCTVWDLNRASTNPHSSDLKTHHDTAGIKTQLIAHDSEIFDVKFLNNSLDIFASVGNDGSMRVFDLRSLEHSTIIYEPPTASQPVSSDSHSYNSYALMKLAASNIDQYTLATVAINSNSIILIDMRMPGVPLSVLDGSFGGLSSAAINSITWHPTSNYLLSGGDDCEALIWDCNGLPLQSNSKLNSSVPSPPLIEEPTFAYQSELEINNVCWKPDSSNWFGVVSGKSFQAVNV